jgi:hypothetical protein
MAPSDCSFHNGLPPHRAGANMTRHRHLAMTRAYTPLGATFGDQRNILPQDDFRSPTTASPAA